MRLGKATIIKSTLLAATAFALVAVAAACGGGGDSSDSAPAAQPTRPPVTTSQPTASAQPTKPPTATQPATTQPVRKGKISPTWIPASLTDGTVSISRAAVDKAGMAHFKAPVNGENLPFMAYTFGGQLMIRANLCVPCRSTSYSLDGDRLVCDTCGTIFKASTGGGVSGACMNYPKASVAFQIADDNVLMKASDVKVAWDNTLKPGLP